jgi:Rrf2 family cysteine metabolism transcriptional repressor
VRGKSGGYLLARPPAQITLGDVLQAAQGDVFDTPALSDRDCPPELRHAWQGLRKTMERAVEAITFQQLVEEGADKERMYYI